MKRNQVENSIKTKRRESIEVVYTNSLRKEKGITLIALVITIIVLLILAGVTIAALSGDNGILKRASEAKEKTEDIEEKEKVELSALEAVSQGNGNIIDKNNLKNILDKNLGAEKYNFLGNTTNGWQIILDNNSYVIKEDGEVIKTNWIETEDKIIESIDGKITLNVGDYINYNPTIDKDGKEKSLTYISPKGTYNEDFGSMTKENLVQGNGYADQQFSSNSYTGKWRLLGIEDGRLLIVSEDMLEPDNGGYQNQETGFTCFGIRGQTGATFGVDELNNICEIFGHGYGANSARSLNIDDVNKITGFNPNNVGVYDPHQLGEGTNCNIGELFEYGNEVTYYWLNDNTYTRYTASNGLNGSYSGGVSGHYNSFGFTWYDFNYNWKNMPYYSDRKICTLKSTWYTYYPQTLTANISDDNVGISESSSAYDMIFRNPSLENSWLASSSIKTAINGSFCSIRKIGNGAVGSFNLYTSWGESLNGIYYGVRPVVSLEAEIYLEANGANNWIIK